MYKFVDMDKNIAIRVQHLTKQFVVADTTVNTVKQLIFSFSQSRQTKFFTALKDVSFEIQKGEKIGFIGRNGSGKSTLTKIIANIYMPTQGSVEVNGSIMLMNLGLGINQELTARENIYLSASILGHTIKQIDAFFDELLAFAELQEFADRKVKYFSSGMQSRLSFSIALYARADTMILDEIFAVGDAKFIDKATRALEEKILKNATIILISHSDAIIEKYCSKAGYLKNGNLVFFGDTKTALELYKNEQI